MLQTMSVFDGVRSDRVTVTPYPHLVVQNAIDRQLCQELIRQFPPIEVFTRGRRYGDNVKLYYPAHRALHDSRVSGVWKIFLRHHLTRAFYQQALDVFRPFLNIEYPHLESQYGRSLDTLRVGIAGQQTFEECDILLNALIGIHTPVTGPARLERRPHVKVHDKFLEGFLYLRPDDDDAQGGDYEFFSVPTGTRPRYGRWAQTDRACLTLERTVPYRSNTLVTVVNTSRSIQAMTARGPGRRPLMYLNITIQTPRMLFDLNYSPAGRIHRLLRGLLDRVAPA
jgi:hypothetical protein